MPDAGLRERKKARTRRVIADAAARLFAERGYEQVAVSDVAREAEVSEQTVYNYFQTKEQLVTDLDQDFQDQISRLIRTRALGTTPAAAIRELVLDAVEGIRRVPPAQWRGELGYLAAISPTVHRLALEMSDRQAQAIAAVLRETSAVAPRARQAAWHRPSRRIPNHHQRGRATHPGRAKPRRDRRRATTRHRRRARRHRPLACARRKQAPPGGNTRPNAKAALIAPGPRASQFARSATPHRQRSAPVRPEGAGSAAGRAIRNCDPRRAERLGGAKAGR